MAGTAFAHAVLKQEDPLEHLPCSRIEKYRRGESIYDDQRPQAGLYLMIDGMVAISRRTRRSRVVLDVCMRDEFFGESVLAGVSDLHESAIAHENTKVMVWTAEELNGIIASRPRLSTALLQMVVKRGIEQSHRIEVLTGQPIQRRLLSALSHFAQKTGEPVENGGISMPHFTHEFLSEYIGTSREIVTVYMNRFRRLGWIRYSMREMLIYPLVFSDDPIDGSADATPS